MGNDLSISSRANLSGQYDKAALDQLIKEYLDAMVAHDPSHLPLSPNVRFTENTVAIKIGQGLWGSITGISPYRMQFSDPQTGQVGFMGRILEHHKPCYFAARLKVEEGKITEIESIVARFQKWIKDDKAEAVRPVFFETVPMEQRTPRAEMTKAVHGYFDALVQGNGDLAPFAPECVRVENGLQTTSARPGLFPLTPGGLDIGILDCKEQITTRIYSNNTHIDRRFWLVDEEKGVIFGLFIFNMDGAKTTIQLSNGEVVPPINRPVPASIPIAELFRITGGKIRQIEAVFGGQLPFGIKTGWE
jgi:hypothetical protein